MMRNVLCSLLLLAGCGEADPTAVVVPPPAPPPAPPPPAAVRLVALAVSPHADTLLPGDTLRFTTRLVWSDSTTRPVPIAYAATGGTMTSTGLFTAGTALGTFAVVASCACASVDSAAPALRDTARVVVVAPPPQVETVPLRLHRMDGGSGDVLVSNGIPVPAGWVDPTASPVPVRVKLGTTEVPVYAEVLKGKHKDGSAMSMLVQFVWPASHTGDATFEVGAPSSVGARSKIDLNGALPAAAALPIDPEYLVSTMIVGPTVSRFNAPQSPAYFPEYERLFDQYAEQHWVTYGFAWAPMNLYDRVLNQYAFWVRTGNPVLWERAARVARDYRAGYLEANNFATTEWWAQLDGLAIDYWLTGDDRSRQAVYKTAESLHRSRGGQERLTNTTSHPWMDNRNQAKVLGSKVWSHRLESPAFGAVTNWEAGAREDLGWILGTQTAEGPFLFKATCGFSNNFMAGLLSVAFIDYFEHIEADPRVLQAVSRVMDWLWRTQWRPSDQVFNYYSGVCPVDGGPDPAWDLNGLYLQPFGWLGKRTGDPQWFARGDAIWAGMVAKTWLVQTKQFNQMYWTSWRYLGYRQ